MYRHVLKIKADGTHNIFIGRQALVNIVCVVNNVTAENEAAPNGKDEVHGAAERNENADKASHA